MKNTVMSDQHRYIHVLGYTTMGSMHDYALLNFEFDPSQDWFARVAVYVDTAYIGMLKDYEVQQLLIPFKCKRKAKGEPKDELSDEQKQYNKELASVRIKVEHAIGGMKIWHSLKHVWRGRRFYVEDLIMLIGAGLWNAHLTLTSKTPTVNS